MARPVFASMVPVVTASKHRRMNKALITNSNHKKNITTTTTIIIIMMMTMMMYTHNALNDIIGASKKQLLIKNTLSIQDADSPADAVTDHETQRRRTN